MIIGEEFPCDANGSALLSQGGVVLKVGGREYRGDCATSLVLSPTPRVVLDVTAEGMSPFETFLIAHPPSGEPVHLEVESVALPAVVTKCEYTTATPELHLCATVSGHPPSFPAQVGDLKYVTFQVVNFWPFMGQREAGNGGTWTADTVTLRGGGWQVQVNSLEATKARIDTASQGRGFAITHAGRFEREDGTGFSSDEADALLDSLDYFLSFCRGGWSGPILPVGFNQAGQRIWWTWRAGRADGWTSHMVWFDHHHCGSLVELFSKFIGSQVCRTHDGAVARAIYWYIAANRAANGIDTALIVAQVSLELLAWLVLVAKNRTLTVVEFKKLPSAAEKMRRLLDHIGVGSGIPPVLTELTRAAGSLKNPDGPGVLTELRNDLAHPERYRAALQTSAVLREAWNLALYYTELSLLYYLGYQGEFSNRLTMCYVGQAEAVPWASKGDVTP